MSDLQVSLLVIGAVVVGAVYLFNWTQERRLRQRLERAFGTEHDDVLLRPAPVAAEPDQRVEPLMQPQERQPEAIAKARRKVQPEPMCKLRSRLQPSRSRRVLTRRFISTRIWTRWRRYPIP